jgi:UDP-GlcNAc:undecaprenyl-phosphate GlcNAc-1-phosphate transferase
MVLIGIVDDIHGLGSRVKFALQFPVAIILVIGGAKFDSINFPLVGHVALGPLGPFLSILWLVGVTNAVNLIDGVDGLASGVAYLIALAIATLSIYSGQIYLAIVMCSVAGACLGFLRYNFSPAKIFLGDSGSLFLGITLAISSIQGSYKEKLGTSLFVPVILMGYPIADTLLSMVRRFVRGKPMFTGDASHIHHRLLLKGLDHRKVCWVIYSVTFAFCLWTFAIEKRQTGWIIIGALVNCVLIAQGLYQLGYISFFMSPKVSKERNQFKAAHFFSEMVKAKFALAEARDEVVQLLKASSSEFKLSSIQVDFLKNAEADPGAAIAEQQQNALVDVQGPVVKLDRYHYTPTGLTVKAVFASGADSDELVTERRMLFGELCKAADQRLQEILEHSCNEPMAEKASPDKAKVGADTKRR